MVRLPGSTVYNHGLETESVIELDNSNIDRTSEFTATATNESKQRTGNSDDES